jgi:hypothetical protein
MNDVETVKAHGLEISIDRNNGGITSISHPSTGMLLNIDSERAGLVDLAYPIETFYPLRLSTRFSRATVSGWEKGVKITWDVLGPNRRHVLLPDGRVCAEVCIQPSEDNLSVIMSCRIENKSRNPIPQVMFPDLHGLKPFAGVEETKLRMAAGAVQPFKAPLRAPHVSDYYISRYWKSYAPGPFGSQNWVRWIDYGSGTCKKLVPAKATSPILSPLKLGNTSKTASFVLSSLSGFTSVASILLEVSMAKTISTPRLVTSCHSKPHCGPIRAITNITTEPSTR